MFSYFFLKKNTGTWISLCFDFCFELRLVLEKIEMNDEKRNTGDFIYGYFCTLFLGEFHSFD